MAKTFLRKISDIKIVWISLLVGMTLSSIMYVSNWIMLIHLGEWLSTYNHLDISFYYYTPIITWILLTIFFLRLEKHYAFNKLNLKQYLIWLVVLVLVLSPAIRTIDILLDFGIKYLVGMTQVSPWKILNDVWLVVLSSTPWAFFKILIIAALVYFLKAEKQQRHTLAVKTIEGFHQVIDINQIRYLQSEGNYVHINTEHGLVKIRATLKSLETQLGSAFFRIHKSTIVGHLHVKQLKHWRNGEYLVVMTDDKPLTSIRSFKDSIDQIKDLMAKHFAPEKHPQLETVRPTLA